MADQTCVFHPPYRFEASEHGPVTIYDAVDVAWIARVKESLPHKEELAAAMVAGLNTAGRCRVEWAVVEDVFRGTAIRKGGLGSREEAEAWLTALDMTTKREDYEHFMATDGITMRGPLEVAWRYIDGWHSASEESESE